MSDKKETILTDRLPEKNIVNNDTKVIVGSEVSNLAPVVENWIELLIITDRSLPVRAVMPPISVTDGEAIKSQSLKRM